MRWIRQYTLYTYIKQRYHRRSIWVVMVVFVFSYILAWLSPSDTAKIFAELSVSILEVLFVLWALVVAVVMWNKKAETTTHIIHSQWLSYQQIFLAHRSVGITILLYLSILMCGGLFLIKFLGMQILGIVLISLYLWLKVVLLYTIVFVLTYHITSIISAVFWLALYMLFYSVWLIESRSQWLGVFTQWLVSFLVYTMPQFVSIGQNTIHIDWLSSNIFTIVMSYGIYIIFLLVLGAQSYGKIRWK